MKKNFLILSILAVSLSSKSFAEITTADTVSPDYLKNHGYSSSIIQATQRSTAQVNGENYEPNVEKKIYEVGFIKGIRKFFMYLDPAYDDQSFFNNHEIHTSPNYQDL